MNFSATRIASMAAAALAFSAAASAQQTATVDVDVSTWSSWGGRAATQNSSAVIQVPPGMTRIARIAYSGLTYNTLNGSWCNELRLGVEAIPTGGTAGATTNNILAVSPTGAVGATCDAGFTPAAPGTASSQTPNSGAAFVVPAGATVRVFVWETFDDPNGGAAGDADIQDSQFTAGTLTVTFDDGTYNPCSPLNQAITNANGSNTLGWRNETIVPTLTAAQTGCTGDSFKANFYPFTATGSGPHTFSTCGSTTRRLYLLSDCSNPSSVIACGNATTTSPCTSTGGWTATASLTAGQTVYVAVGASTATTNLGTTVTVTVLSPYVACTTANLPANSYSGYGSASSLAYRGDALVPDLDLPGCGVLYRANLWKYTPGVSGTYTFRTCNSSATLVRRLAVLSDCSSSATVLGCGADTTTGCTTGGQEVNVNLTANVPVYLAIGGTSATSLGTTVSAVIIGPENPDCANAATAQFGTNVFGNESTAFDQAVTTNALGTSTSTIAKVKWYRFRPGATGLYTFSLCGSVNDTKIALSASACGVRLGTAVTSLAYNDDSCACTSGCGTAGNATYSSRLTATTTGLPLTQDLVAGQTYYILVGGYASTTALVSGNLVIDGPPQPPPSCPADIDGNGEVGGSDLSALLAAWGSNTADADIDGNGTVGGPDLTALLAAWGSCAP